MDRFNECRQQLLKMPGIGVTKEEQIKSLDALRQQLILKKQLLMKYKNSCPFDPNQKL
jgi:mediator of RNA polymerase II transcription subunit 9